MSLRVDVCLFHSVCFLSVGVLSGWREDRDSISDVRTLGANKTRASKQMDENTIATTAAVATRTVDDDHGIEDSTTTTPAFPATTTEDTDGGSKMKTVATDDTERHDFAPRWCANTNRAQPSKPP